MVFLADGRHKSRQKCRCVVRKGIKEFGVAE